MNARILKTNYLLAPVFGFAALSASMAQAQVEPTLTRIIPASECVYTLGNDVKISSYGNLYNSSTTTSYSAICPIQYESSDYGAPESFRVALTDKSSVANFSCYAGVLAVDGVTIAKGTIVSTTGKDLAPNMLDLDAPDVTGGSWHVRCTIPRRGASESSSILTAILMYQPELP